MHLVYKALDRRAIPSTLPKELQKGFLKQEDISGGFVANFEMAGNIVPVAPVIPAPSRTPQPGASVPAIPAPGAAAGDWVLSTVEKLKYQELFEKCDLDRDGMVSGVEIKDVFLKSGLQTQLLAHVWALCDTDQSGKLSNEQFALACWFIDRKKKGIDPPQALTPEMVPPSMRPGAAGPAKVGSF
jgi:epidermal growth factor receptor substrate 15